MKKENNLTVREQKNLDKAKRITSKLRKSPATPLPPEVSQLNEPGMVDYFKMLSIMETGDSRGWELIREDFIKHNARKTNPKKAENSLMDQANNISKEDQIMNDFSRDTNGIIEQISKGTVEQENFDKLDKMKIVEGDMPGQGKEKQGNWRG